MLAWQSVLYFTILNIAAALGLPALMANFKDDLELVFSTWTGK